MIRTVFMGTPDFAVPVLQALKACADLEIVGVYTQPDRPVGRGLSVRPSPVKAKALEFGLSIYQPEKLSAPGEFEKLQTLAPEVIVVVAFGQILKRNVLELPKIGCINIHASLLPRWRGAAPIQRAILDGDKESGVTTMLMAEKLDAGEMLLTAKTPITNEDTAGSLHDRLSKLGAELIVPTIKGLTDRSLRPIKQDEAQVTYAAKLTKEMEKIDTAQSAEVLHRRIRALNPWPGTSAYLSSGDRIKIKKVGPIHRIKDNQGRIFERAGMVLLGAADGAIELRGLQWEGKKEVGPDEFLNGLKGRSLSLPLSLA